MWEDIKQEIGDLQKKRNGGKCERSVIKWTKKSWNNESNDDTWQNYWKKAGQKVDKKR